MHEMSVALEVCRMAEERLGLDALARVTAIGLEVGDEAGIVPENLEFCLGVLLTQPPFVAARPVLARCRGDVLRLDFLEIDDDDRSSD